MEDFYLQIKWQTFAKVSLISTYKGLKLNDTLFG